MSDLQPIYDLSNGSGLSAAWSELETVVPHSYHTGWTTKVMSLPDSIDVTRSATFDTGRVVCLVPGWSDPEVKERQGPPVRPDCWALLSMTPCGAVNAVALDAVGPTPEAAYEVVKWLKDVLSPVS